MHSNITCLNLDLSILICQILKMAIIKNRFFSGADQRFRGTPRKINSSGNFLLLKVVI